MALAAINNFDENRQPKIAVRTPLALDSGLTGEIISFSDLCDPGEHIALVYPSPAAQKTPLVRLHSECLTGDVLSSAQCDCGHQLREAKSKMQEQGGILLYLRQEGRGIGLYNKIKAYQAQREQGLDTFAANRHLGFDDDPRNFRVAAEMLAALGVSRIRLLTNNPDKVSQISACGITVEETIPTTRYETPANRTYLQTKRKNGHTI